MRDDVGFGEYFWNKFVRVSNLNEDVEALKEEV